VLTITDKEFRQLADYIREHYGINLKEEKKSLVSGRLHSALLQKKFNSFSAYYDYIVSDKTGEAAKTLIDKISTNHTYFMREESHFNFLQSRVLPYLTRIVKDKDLRIWSAGCSTGEEPSTLAMVIDDFFGLEKPFWDTRILATDISSKVLDVAAKGIYENEKLVNRSSPNLCVNSLGQKKLSEYVLL